VRKRVWLIAALVALIVVALFIILPIWLSTKGEVLIINEADEAIHSGQIEICNQRFPLGQIEPKQTKQFHYKINFPSDYDLTIEFASGKKLTRHIGYVTSAWDFHDTVTMKNDDVICVTSPD
jgi:hypothetical protein